MDFLNVTYDSSWTAIRQSVLDDSSNWNISTLGQTKQKLAEVVKGKIHETLQNNFRLGNEIKSLHKIITFDLIGLGPLSFFMEQTKVTHIVSSSKDLTVYFEKPNLDGIGSHFQSFPVPWLSIRSMHDVIGRIAKSFNARIDEFHSTLLRPCGRSQMLELVQYPAADGIWIRLRPITDEEKIYYQQTNESPYSLVSILNGFD